MVGNNKTKKKNPPVVPEYIFFSHIGDYAAEWKQFPNSYLLILILALIDTYQISEMSLRVIIKGRGLECFFKPVSQETW